MTDVGWYGSAYMLTNCAFQLLFGKLYTFFSIKMTFILSVLIFAVGSAICGAAPNSVVFIVGRAVAGLASAGIMAGTVRVTSPVPVECGSASGRRSSLRRSEPCFQAVGSSFECESLADGTADCHTRERPPSA